MTPTARPTVAVWKFASCDGCQLSILDCEEELLKLAGTVRIAYFLEMSRASIKGPYDLSLVEGSITTAGDVERIKQVRSQSRKLITIGACATAEASRDCATLPLRVSTPLSFTRILSTSTLSTPRHQSQRMYR